MKSKPFKQLSSDAVTTFCTNHGKQKLFIPFELNIREHFIVYDFNINDYMYSSCCKSHLSQVIRMNVNKNT